MQLFSYKTSPERNPSRGKTSSRSEVHVETFCCLGNVIDRDMIHSYSFINCMFVPLHPSETGANLKLRSKSWCLMSIPKTHVLEARSKASNTTHWLHARDTCKILRVLAAWIWPMQHKKRVCLGCLVGQHCWFDKRETACSQANLRYLPDRFV